MKNFKIGDRVVVSGSLGLIISDCIDLPSEAARVYLVKFDIPFYVRDLALFVSIIPFGEDLIFRP